MYNTFLTLYGSLKVSTFVFFVVLLPKSFLSGRIVFIPFKRPTLGTRFTGVYLSISKSPTVVIVIKWFINLAGVTYFHVNTQNLDLKLGSQSFEKRDQSQRYYFWALS